MARTTRDAILEGVQGATRLHRELGIREATMNCGGAVNVFKAIDQRGYGLLFRPLEGLLGLCMQHPEPGVLVTTNRSLSVQRFTAAHELGHLELGHEFSLDNEEMIWRPRGRSKSELQEVAANAFGAHFLLPKWLLRTVMDRHKWGINRLSDPIVVYQLSLRLGLSYEATCNSLQRLGLLANGDANDLSSIKPKQIKAQLLAGDSLSDPWADVWLLTEHDHSGVLEAGPNDLFFVNLVEHGAGGYLWSIDELAELGFEVQAHEYDTEQPGDNIGGAMERQFRLSADKPSTGRICLRERRPWQPDDVISEFEIAYSLMGKEVGMPRFQRSRSLAA